MITPKTALAGSPEHRKPFDEAEAWRWWYSFAHRTVTTVGRTALGIRVWGQENIPQEGGAILAAGPHRTFLQDVLAFPSAVPRRHVRMAAKYEAFSYPIIGCFIRQWGALPIHRDENRPSEAIALARAAKEGHLVGMMPEGTREKGRSKAAHHADLSEFRGGVALVARLAEAPTVPTALYGMDRHFPRRQRAIIFGETLDPPARREDQSAWMADLRGHIEDLYKQADEYFSSK